MLTPQIATLEELKAEGVDWKDTEKSFIRVAQLELREGRVLGEGYYLRAAIAHFGEKWWQLCVSPRANVPISFGTTICMIRPGILPNHLIFDLIIPPRGHALRRELLLPPFPSIKATILEACISLDHRYDDSHVMDCLKDYLRDDGIWDEMILWKANMAIPAVTYCLVPPEKVSKKVFTSLLPSENALNDVEFWMRECPMALVFFYLQTSEINYELRFRELVSAQVWDALCGHPYAYITWWFRYRQRMARNLAADSLLVQRPAVVRPLQHGVGVAHFQVAVAPVRYHIRSTHTLAQRRAQPFGERGNNDNHWWQPSNIDLNPAHTR